MRTSSKQRNSILVKHDGHSRGRKFILDIVHGGDGTLGIRFLGVSDKAEAAAAAGVSILDHDLWGEKKNRIRGMVAHSGIVGQRNGGQAAVAQRAPPSRPFAHHQQSGRSGQRRQRKEIMKNRRASSQLTASSTAPNSSNFWRKVPSSVCQARPLRCKC